MSSQRLEGSGLVCTRLAQERTWRPGAKITASMRGVEKGATGTGNWLTYGRMCMDFRYDHKALSDPSIGLRGGMY